MNKPLPSPIKPKSSQQGIVLLEALIAVLLFSMGVLALVGLQAAMMKNTEDSKIRSEASNIAQRRLGFMWADPNNLANYVETASDISTLIPNGKRTVALVVTGAPATATTPNTLNSQVTVTIEWQQPGKEQHLLTTVANIAGG